MATLKVKKTKQHTTTSSKLLTFI